MKKPLYVFDFDGTIADSLPLYSTILNDLAQEYGYKPLDEHQIALLRGKPPQAIISYVGIAKFRLPFFIRRVLQEVHAKIELLPPVKTMPEVLFALRERGHHLGVLTSNSEKNVRKFLSLHNLAVFDFIYSGSTIFGKSALLNRMLKDRKLIASDVVYVGDEVRDIQAAHKSKIKIIAVSWGANTKELLKKHAPDYLIMTPEELLKPLDRL